MARVLSLKEASSHFGEEMGQAIREGAMAGLYSAAQRMVNHIQTDVIPKTVPEPVDRGVYRAAWRASRTSDGAMYENTVPYAGAVEHGVRAQNVKIGRRLIDALAEWAVRKGIATPQKTNRIAWAIATSMAASVQVTRGGAVRTIAGGGRGIFNGGKGLRIMERAAKDLPDILREEVKREIEKAFLQ